MSEHKPRGIIIVGTGAAGLSAHALHVPNHTDISIVSIQELKDNPINPTPIITFSSTEPESKTIDIKKIKPTPNYLTNKKLPRKKNKKP